MGDYFFGGTWGKGGRGFNVEPNSWRLDTIVEAIRNDTHVPLKNIFNYTQSQYYSNAGLCYAEGWSICYFFLTSDVAKKRGYSRLPQMMWEELRKSGDWKKATDKVFRGVDMDRMEQEWKEFVLSLAPEKPEEKPEDAEGK